MFYERLKKICEEKGTNVTNLSEKINISSGNMSRWKNGGDPKSKTLIAIADELEISIDYLLGRDDFSDKKQFSPNEKKLLEMFRQLTDIDKGIILGRMEKTLEDYSKKSQFH